ncbi:ADP-ribosyl cyclase/cyclic ADP-ribose hydrolase [Citrus sinensis]|nr:ADP-ribosyl cyclase/cyclic ADP-ribose hydrolase [Citrus sinensis]
MNPRNNEYDVSVMASSSSSPRNSNKHGIFLSFRGEDTRDNFTSHLYSALCHNNIETFIDNDLKRGDEISQSLLDTIEASTISIIIFSERYASSGWCLDELLKILECKHVYGQIVIPVFCRVDPSHVRWQTGTFGDYFSKLGERFPKKMQRWRSALTEAANLSGFDSHVIRPESKLVEEIANEILERLDDTFQSYNKDLVGVEWRIKEIESLLCTGSAGAYILGIWGIGGIGKTTIADAVFNKISRHFEGSYFAQNVREAEETGGMKDLQKELLSKLLNDRNVRNIESQLNRLARKKVLIVFDDVTHPRQIESLIRRLDRLASGSRVIITTRDKQVLKNCWASQIYQMEELVYTDAQKLFSQYAFRGGHLDASYTEVTYKAIKYAHGVPLALKVLGRHLCERSKEEWESAMRKLEIIPHMEIQEVLKISYDTLDDSQKNVFLDIACFLEGEHRDVVISFFDASGFQARIELSVLEGKSLITLNYHDHIRMHDLLRDMGRDIVRKESIDHPGNRSRLWHHKDIYEVFKKNTGTEAIKGISLDMSKINKGVPFTELRYFEWHQFPLKTLNILHWENLVSLKMPGSKVTQLWDDVQNLVSLKRIDLKYSKLLTKLPDLSLARNLEILDLGYCSSLTETHSSIQYLNKLEVLDLDRCESLTSLPTSIHSKYLTRLVLRGCSNLKNLPKMTSCHLRRTLPLLGVGIEELPSSIECLSNIGELLIYNCKRLENISSSIFKLQFLESIRIHRCPNLQFLEIPSCNIDGTRSKEQPSSELKLKKCPRPESLPSGQCMFKSLTSLEIIDCPNFERLPDELGNLQALNRLIIDGTAIRELPEGLGQLALLSKLELKNCSELEYISSSIFKLKSVESIEISNCSNLKGFPEIPFCNIDGSGIERIPSSVLKLNKCSKLESLPSSLCMFKSLTSLEIIDCKKLERLPDELGNLEALEELRVEGTGIREVPKSLAQLALSKLKLKKCSSFESLPSRLYVSKSLTSLEIIDCKNFMRLPDEIGNLEYLKVLTIKGTAIREVPESLGQLSSLEWLVLSDNNLQIIPESLNQLSSLVSLKLSNNNLERIPERLDPLSSLKYLDLFENNLDRIPEYLRSFPTSIPSEFTSLRLSVDLRNCLKLDPNELSEIIKDGWMKQSVNGETYITKSMYFPGNGIPKWFRHQSMGSTISLKTPQPTGYNKLMGFAFCVVVACSVSECCRHESVEDDRKCNLFDVVCDRRSEGYDSYTSSYLGKISHVESDHVFLGSSIFAAQAPKIASSQVVRIAKEFYRDGPPKAALSEFESSLAERESLKSILTGDPNSRLQRKSKIFRDELVQLVGLIVQSSEDKRSFALQLSCQFEGKFYNTLQLTATGAAGRASCAPHEAAGTARDRERDCAAALASCAPPEAAVGTACDRDRDCAAARASYTPPEADGTARDRRLSVVLLL